jgi:hypothetical protein
MPDSTIPDGGGVADKLLLAACSKTLARLGAEVRIHPDGENLVRALQAAPGFAPRATPDAEPARFEADARGALDRTSSPVARVEACGLPNLLHELVHVALAGRLADDHGIDYQAIPFDLATVPGRAVLWDEVAACVVSCAYLLGRRHDPEGSDWVGVDAWFDEQLGIQPVFYGMDDEPERFWSMLPRIVATHRDEQRAMLDAAYDRVATLLRVGADYERAPMRLTFDTLWQRRGRS